MKEQLPEEFMGLPETPTMPVIFVGHGNPMNAIEDNFYTNEWKKIASTVPYPKAVLCISAHWLTKGSWVTAMEWPRTIHDFYGFPKTLFDVNYPAPGAPEFARLTKSLVDFTKIELDEEWGLDHGTWSVLLKMFPKADVPVYQLSIDYHKPSEYHYELAAQLRKLRTKGVLIMGSGNIVHNLRLVQFQENAFDWTVEFDQVIKDLLVKRDDNSILHYDQLGSVARLAVPTPDHYYPLVYTLGVTDKTEQINFFSEKNTMGAISMRSLLFRPDA